MASMDKPPAGPRGAAPPATGAPTALPPPLGLPPVKPSPSSHSHEHSLDLSDDRVVGQMKQILDEMNAPAMKLPTLAEKVSTKQTLYHQYAPAQVRAFLKPYIKKMGPVVMPYVIMLDETIKPLVEMLIYWEGIMDVVTYLTVVFWTWFLTYMGFSVVWSAGLLFLGATAFRRNYRRLRLKLRMELMRELGKNRLITDSETVEWMNLMLARFWLMFEPYLSEQVQVNVNGILETFKPAFLYDLKLSQFTLGSEAPRIESIKMYPSTDEDILSMDWHITFTPFSASSLSKEALAVNEKKNSKIVLTAWVGKGLATIPIPIEVSDCQMNGKFNIFIKLGRNFPHVKTIDACFTALPDLDFNLKPLKGMDLLNLPLLSNWIMDITYGQLSQFVVAPEKIHIDVEAILGALVQQEVPVGVLKVTIFEARNIKNADKFGGKSDPFVKVTLDKRQVAATASVTDNLNPFYNETFYVIVNNTHLSRVGAITSDELVLAVYDENKVKKDLLLGSVRTIRLSDHIKLPEAEQPGVLKAEARVNPHGDVNLKLSSTSIEDSTSSLAAQPKLTGDPAVHTTNPLPEDPAKPAPDTTKVVEVLADQWHKLTKHGADDIKARGDLRACVTYYPLPHTSSPPGVVPTLSPDIASGILTIQVHQAKELDASKSMSGKYNPFVVVDINKSQVLKTKSKKRTNAPYFGDSVSIFVTDVDCKARFVIKDSRGLAVDPVVGDLTLNVQEIIKLPEPRNDWFKLENANSGRLRVSFQFVPVDLFSENDPDAEVSKLSRGDIVATGMTNKKTRIPIGVLRLGLLDCKDLKNVEFGSKSDPYVRVRLNGHSQFKSHTRDNDLNPIWNETTYIIIHSVRDKFEFEIMDYNALQKDKFLGKAMARVSEIMGGTVPEAVVLKPDPEIPGLYDMRLKLMDMDKAQKLIPGKGELHMDAVFFPVATLIKKQVMRRQSVSLGSSNADLVAAAGASGLATVDRAGGGSVSGLGGEEMTLREEVDFSQCETGVLRVDLAEIRNIPGKSDQVLVEVYLDDKLIFTSDLHRKSEVVIDEVFEYFITSTSEAVLTFKLMGSGSQSVPGTGVPTGATTLSFLGEHRVDFKLLLEEKTGFKQPAWLKLVKTVRVETKKAKATKADAPVDKTLAVHVGDIRLGFGFLPIDVGTMADCIAYDEGVLEVEILKASNLIPVDRSGTSDPYVLCTINDSKVLKSATHKKTLNAVINESFSVPIASRIRSNLKIEVRDYNKVEAHKSLGTINIPLSKIKPVNSVLEKEWTLQDVAHGTLHFRMAFFPGKIAGLPGDPLTKQLVGDTSEDRGTLFKMGKAMTHAPKSMIKAPFGVFKKKKGIVTQPIQRMNTMTSAASQESGPVLIEAQELASLDVEALEDGQTITADSFSNLASLGLATRVEEEVVLETAVNPAKEGLLHGETVATKPPAANGMDLGANPILGDEAGGDVLPIVKTPSSLGVDDDLKPRSRASSLLHRLTHRSEKSGSDSPPHLSPSSSVAALGSTTGRSLSEAVHSATLSHEEERRITDSILAAPGVLAITVMEAKDLKGVDYGGTSDPFVKVTKNGTKLLHKTQHLRKTLSPVWKEQFTVPMPGMSAEPEVSFHFLIKDYNRVTESVEIGSVVVPFWSFMTKEGKAVPTLPAAGASTSSEKHGLLSALGLGGAHAGGADKAGAAHDAASVSTGATTLAGPEFSLHVEKWFPVINGSGELHLLFTYAPGAGDAGFKHRASAVLNGTSRSASVTSLDKQPLDSARLMDGAGPGPVAAGVAGASATKSGIKKFFGKKDPAKASDADTDLASPTTPTTPSM